MTKKSRKDGATKPDFKYKIPPQRIVKKPDKQRPRRKALPDPAVPLVNPRQELFASNVAIGVPLRDSYEVAGYEGVGNNFSRLNNIPAVKQRIQYLREKAVLSKHAVIIHESKQSIVIETDEALKTLGITKEYLLRHLQMNITMASEVGQFTASNKAIAMLWAVLTENDTKDKNNLTPAQKIQQQDKDVNLNVLLNFAENISTPPEVVIIPKDDPRLRNNDDLGQHERD